MLPLPEQSRILAKIRVYADFDIINFDLPYCQAIIVFQIKRKKLGNQTNYPTDPVLPELALWLFLISHCLKALQLGAMCFLQCCKDCHLQQSRHEIMSGRQQGTKLLEGRKGGT